MALPAACLGMLLTWRASFSIKADDWSMKCCCPHIPGLRNTFPVTAQKGSEALAFSGVQTVSDVTLGHFLRRRAGESGRLSAVCVVWSLAMVSACIRHPIPHQCSVILWSLISGLPPFSSLLCHFGSLCSMLLLVWADSKRELVMPQILYPHSLVYAQSKNMVM